MTTQKVEVSKVGYVISYVVRVSMLGFLAGAGVAIGVIALGTAYALLLDVEVWNLTLRIAVGFIIFIGLIAGIMFGGFGFWEAIQRVRKGQLELMEPNQEGG